MHKQAGLRVSQVFYAVCLAYALCGLASLAYTESGWHWRLFAGLGSLRMMPPFADLRVITATAGCQKDLMDIAKGVVVNCHPYFQGIGLGYPLPSFWLARVLGITEDKTMAGGLISGLLLTGCIHWLSRRGRKETKEVNAVTGLLLIGLPFQLIIERGNIDCLIFSLLLFIGRLVDINNYSTSLNRAAKRLAVGALSFAVTATKIYPAIGLSLWMLAEKRQVKDRRHIFSAVTAGAFLAMLFVVQWTVTGDESAKPGIGLISHGLSLQIGSGIFGRIGGLAGIAVFGVAAIYGAIQRKSWRDSDKKMLKSRIIKLDSGPLICATTWVACFAVTGNYDYRLVLLYPAAIFIAESASINMISRLITSIVCAQVVAPLGYFYFESLRLDNIAIASPAAIGLAVKYASFWIIRVLDIAGLPMIAGLLSGFLFPKATNKLNSNNY